MTWKQITKMEEIVIEFYVLTGEKDYLFHEGFKTENRRELRERLFFEEVQEFFKSFEIKDIEQMKISQLKAIVGMLYVAVGNMIEKSYKTYLGEFRFLVLRNEKSELDLSEVLIKRTEFDDELILEAFKELHRSNLTKIIKDGKIFREKNGKIINPSNFKEPNLSQILKREWIKK